MPIENDNEQFQKDQNLPFPHDHTPRSLPLVSETQAEKNVEENSTTELLEINVKEHQQYDQIRETQDNQQEDLNQKLQHTETHQDDLLFDIEKVANAQTNLENREESCPLEHEDVSCDAQQSKADSSNNSIGDNNGDDDYDDAAMKEVEDDGDEYKIDYDVDADDDDDGEEGSDDVDKEEDVEYESSQESDSDSEYEPKRDELLKDVSKRKSDRPQRSSKRCKKRIKCDIRLTRNKTTNWGALGQTHRRDIREIQPQTSAMMQAQEREKQRQQRKLNAFLSHGNDTMLHHPHGTTVATGKPATHQQQYPHNEQSKQPLTEQSMKQPSFQAEKNGFSRDIHGAHINKDDAQHNDLSNPQQQHEQQEIKEVETQARYTDAEEPDIEEQFNENTSSSGVPVLPPTSSDISNTYSFPTSDSTIVDDDLFDLPPVQDDDYSFEASGVLSELVNTSTSSNAQMTGVTVAVSDVGVGNHQQYFSHNIYSQSELDAPLQEIPSVQMYGKSLHQPFSTIHEVRNDDNYTLSTSSNFYLPRLVYSWQELITLTYNIPPSYFKFL